MSLSILIVEDNIDHLVSLSGKLEKKGYEVLAVESLAKAREHLRAGEGDIVIADHLLGDGLGTSLIADAKRSPCKPPVIMITAYGDIQLAVDAMKAGAADFIPKPYAFEALEASILKAGERVTAQRELDSFRAIQHQGYEFIIGKSIKMQRLYAQAKRAAEREIPVLLSGETGTGKEIMARWIHMNSRRSSKLFWAINCASIQASLLESELFGHEKGAFTNADTRKLGQFEIADGGIIFLDEISSMPIDVQPQLLRAIEEQTFTRLGGVKSIEVDVHFIAASNRNLPEMIEKGTFRDDLYYRLNSLDLHIPALRERKEDIPELVGFLIKRTNSLKGLNIQGISPQAVQAVMEYNWPGNIRELRNEIELAMAFTDGPVIQLDNLSDKILFPKHEKPEEMVK